MTTPDLTFIADDMLGRLARYMRILGLDVLYIPGISDRNLISLAKKENRIVLTRDTHLLRRREFSRNILKHLFIQKDAVRDQLAQVAREYHIPLRVSLIRCLECNTPLQPVDKERVHPYVPPHVFQTQENFSHCHKCDKYYWAGTHLGLMEKMLAEIKERG
ncbi:uncharacterized protein HKBW3S44_00537 [Candidatus Hakubella thermalkaliphila]|uniref:Mut7-C RNAse domain-containing protein n=2 Tax=Candidatus Hakubella thermalkaliphila TaxID=2754717 RepID=A0A6V8NU86_9ACTN|nr:Mut7-C RNAse domain-containing protein [Candidatus Hakubella thermalkaliphila]MBT9171010.1 hypothetical protein [Actinomycetota bacterium]GFP22974.1 uncharacterized protein HKBW3S09_00441 [Candidatus Hakubella thermalkaliphila]GFP25065.1 uncharacterized protein HKBW3S25_00515 [Candidatus Hakubella thermalkaliphila]GFP27044.1 uncharacterized protein HKBW3S33_00456 [Candidatus Hakubella thermalkaliphila]GFP29358.1 uncharacterized protein HKBW3S34_00278 [Candidatus Hakubella thermalkaliphila]